MKLLLGIALGIIISGCASVEVHYADAPPFDDVNTAAKLAAAGLSYYSLAKIHLAASPSTKQSDTVGATSGGGTTSQSKALASASKKQTRGTRANTKSTAATPPGKTGAANPQAQGSGTNESRGDSAAANDNASDAPVTSTGNINGQPWMVTLTTVRDATHGFMMGGTNGFWTKTTLTASRTPNSDRPDSVTVKAENLTATRADQIASVLGYVISPGKARAPEGTETANQPPPFDFDIDSEHINATNPIGDQSGWSYRLDIPVPQPSGSVSFNKAIATAKAAAAVNYFPVPACLSAHLYLYRNGAPMADFPLVVANPDVVRLEPLPLDGKLTMSSICGASVQGTTQVAAYDELFSDITALQKAYTQVANPNSGQSGQTGQRSQTGQ